ncbi:DNA (cytosine-5-)-methyltransferase [Ranunculus cassubicifolius]
MAPKKRSRSGKEPAQIPKKIKSLPKSKPKSTIKLQSSDPSLIDIPLNEAPSLSISSDSSDDEGFVDVSILAPLHKPRKARSRNPTAVMNANGASTSSSSPPDVLVDQIPVNEAKRRWPHRYKKEDGLGEKINKAKAHYNKALVDGMEFKLYDCARLKADEGEADYIAKIVELFEGIDSKLYCSAQWFFKPEDTVITQTIVDKLKAVYNEKRVFYSKDRDDNSLDSLVKNITITFVPPKTKKADLPEECDFYCDLGYLPTFSTFCNLTTDFFSKEEEKPSFCEASKDSTLVCEATSTGASSSVPQNKREMKLLDVFSGCGAMSTGLCMGAAESGVNLVTKWAVDFNAEACQSLRHNHPEAQVRNESAADYLSLLKEWALLCEKFSPETSNLPMPDIEPMSDEDEEEAEDDSGDSGEIFVVEQLLEICYGDPKDIKKPGLYFKVRWENYGPEDDTWEPIDGLGDCPEKVKEFVINGRQKDLLPLPGDVDIVCGGPPCQGISGFNRFRNYKAPLDDPKNEQLLVFMNIIEHLNPKFVLMENVVDILKFSGGFLGRYAIGSLVGMNYQVRLGLLAAGCYGLPQFRMRAFFWGALTSENLPSFPRPTHEVTVRNHAPRLFEKNLVPYELDLPFMLSPALELGDAISELPPVSNAEDRDIMPYTEEALTDFQRKIRLPKHGEAGEGMLFDHRPLNLNVDDHTRVSRIPRRKGANFRDLPGVVVNPITNICTWDKDVPNERLPSGNYLVPNYAVSYKDGKSLKPFARLWWDETVPTVVTRAEPHNQKIIHPLQDRVLTVRENARLQGFPDYYKLFGDVKERYTQVGNAVAVPVGHGLGYAFGLACLGRPGDNPLIVLPATAIAPAPQ